MEQFKQQLSEERYRQMLAYEALIRRVAHLKVPLMLKGSYLTRQYFTDPFLRYANDVDWVCMQHLPDERSIQNALNTWFIAITELDLHDGVHFRSFRENAFWREVEYAMADDFPTVNTDLICTVEGVEYHWDNLDVSLNIDIEPAPVPLLYTPLQGEAFVIPYTTPLSLQCAWKLHQTLVSPRPKDIFDLIHLLKHPGYSEQARKEMLQALVNECNVDGINIKKLLPFITDTFVDTYNHPSELAEISPDLKASEQSITSLLTAFSIALQQAGITKETMQSLPAPTKEQRQGFYYDDEYILPSSQEYRYIRRELRWTIQRERELATRELPTPVRLLSLTERIALLLFIGVILMVIVLMFMKH